MREAAALSKGGSDEGEWRRHARAHLGRGMATALAGPPGEVVDLADSDVESTGFGEWLIVEVR